ncbi:MAG TPA: RcnB family protein [Caulobacteraceae bacterium]|jgi:Ni/Co efflux regulator RcnB
MRRTLTLGLILSFSLASLAYAQPPQGDQGKADQPTTRPAQGERPVGRPANSGRPGGGRPGGGTGGGQAGAGPGGGAGAGAGTGGRPGRPSRPEHRPPTTNPGNRPPTSNRPGGRPPVSGVTPVMPVRPGPPANRPVWRPGRPNTWRRPTSSNWFWHGRSMRRFRAPAFAWPSGWTYRRWVVGSTLPRLFLANTFFWNDWWSLGLPGPPPGFAWVRFGPDLLLVNLTTGRIVDVAYGVFF